MCDSFRGMLHILCDPSNDSLGTAQVAFLMANVRVQQNALISTLKDRSGLARILLQRLVALVRRAAVSVSSYGG